MADGGEKLVAGRSCGACTVCCDYLGIDEEELQKPARVLCQHCRTGTGCAIYRTRPHLCRTWYCGWRKIGWLSEALRPDKSGVLVRFVDSAPPGYATNIGVILDAIGGCEALLAREVMLAIGRLIASNVATYLVVPSLPGLMSTSLCLNEELAEPLKQRDDDATVHKIIRAFIHAAVQPKHPMDWSPVAHGAI